MLDLDLAFPDPHLSCEKSMPKKKKKNHLTQVLKLGEDEGKGRKERPVPIAVAHWSSFVLFTFFVPITGKLEPQQRTCLGHISLWACQWGYFLDQ